MTSQSRAIRFQSLKNREICDIRAFDFLNCESTCDLTDVQASIYDRKMARPSDTINAILRCLSLVQSLLLGRDARIWRKRETSHMRLSATDLLRRSLVFLT